MRLLRTDISKGFILDQFALEKAPRYAILSHRWGDNEVLLGDLTSDGPKNDARFAKIIGCCKQARDDGFTHVWIDTCCIDQRNSAELSESINSMFLWYTRAARCYVHLHDVSSKQDPKSKNSAFRASKWFTRGWTVQELIAPRDLVFFTQEWDVMGSKLGLARTIEKITKISYGALCNYLDLTDFSVAEKMSWASNRETTKVEDRAYSLLGIFGVNMTTIYGEGNKAFQRLQYEIISQSDDYSIFAWDVYDPHWYSFVDPDFNLPTCGLLAPSPDSFTNSADIFSPSFLQFANQWSYQETVVDIQRTNTGIRLKVPIFEPSSSTGFTRRDICVMAIACMKRDPVSKRHQTIGIVLQLDHDGYYSRAAYIDLHDADRLANSGGQWKAETIDVGIKERHGRIDNQASSMLMHIPKSYEVVLKSHSLKALLQSSNPIPLQSFEFNRIWCRKHHRDVRDSSKQHTWQWVEDPQTKEDDFVVKVECAFEDTLAQAGNMKHELWYSWQWGDMNLDLRINMESGKFVVCSQVKVSDNRDKTFDSGWINSHTSSKANRYWSVDVPNRGTVGVLITLMDIRTKLVLYELDVMIHPSRSTTLSIDPVLGVGDTESEDETDDVASQSDETGQDSESEQHHEDSPVQWVPACLGVIPEGASEFPDTYGAQCHIVRARREGIINLGFLTDKPWATLINSSKGRRPASRACDYEVLVATSDQLDWVEVQGQFTLEMLGGAKPVFVSGGDADESSLYVARHHRDSTLTDVSWSYGTVRIGTCARLVMNIRHFAHEVDEFDKYEVLVYKQ